MDNKRIATTELDFDRIKANLKEFLRGQDAFSDYDYEGSAMSVLLDILAYNTHYNSLYTNLAINEAFIDSAAKRSSVVSIAKELGYVPASSTCSTATLTVTVTSTDNGFSSLQIPRNSAFSTSVAGTTYTFYTMENTVAYKDSNNAYTFNNVIIKEGTPLTFKWVVSSNSRYIIPNANVDLSTLTVKIQDSAGSDTFVAYTRNEDLLAANSTSLVYFIKEIEGELYEIEFGNDIVGKALSNGNVVNIEYMTCNADAPNGASVFRYTGTELDGGTVTIVPLLAATDGAGPENIDTIRWNAPRAYSAQNRCVTLDDYKSIIYNYYPNAEAVNVWGGESNIPVSYGDVFISIKPKDALVLTTQQRDFILNDVLTKRKLVTIHPKFVDPEYINIQMDVSFYYNPEQTTRSPQVLANLVRASLVDYNVAELRKFGAIFKQSRVSRLIDDTEESIKSNIFSIKLHREIKPLYNQAPEYLVQLVNPIYNSGVPEESILSNGILVQDVPNVCYIDDVPTEGSNIGALRLFYRVGNTKVTVKNVGTVDYANGIISIKNLTITGIDETLFKLVIKPQSNDVASIRNQIVNIAEEFLTVTPIVDTNADNYRFTSSRN